MKQSNIIQSFWHGERLSNIENLCIKSFLKNNYEFHLYAYKNIANLPSGVILKDANEILNLSEFTINNSLYTSENHSWIYGCFADLFRYKLLYLKGGWWHDTDSCCIKRFDFDYEYILAKHCVIHNYALKRFVCCGVMKAPPKSLLFEKCFEKAQNVFKEQNGIIEWASIGPKLVNDTLYSTRTKVRIFEPVAFCPIKYWETKQKFFEPFKPINPNTYCIHFYTSTWSVEDANQIYEKNSLLGYLYEKYN